MTLIVCVLMHLQTEDSDGVGRTKSCWTKSHNYSDWTSINAVSPTSGESS